jgi:hypothetical protein
MEAKHNNLFLTMETQCSTKRNLFDSLKSSFFVDEQHQKDKSNFFKKKSIISELYTENNISNVPVKIRLILKKNYEKSDNQEYINYDEQSDKLDTTLKENSQKITFYNEIINKFDMEGVKHSLSQPKSSVQQQEKLEQKKLEQEKLEREQYEREEQEQREQEQREQEQREQEEYDIEYYREQEKLEQEEREHKQYNLLEKIKFTNICLSYWIKNNSSQSKLVPQLSDIHNVLKNIIDNSNTYTTNIDDQIAHYYNAMTTIKEIYPNLYNDIKKVFDIKNNIQCINLKVFSLKSDNYVNDDIFQDFMDLNLNISKYDYNNYQDMTEYTYEDFMNASLRIKDFMEKITTLMQDENKKSYINDFIKNLQTCGIQLESTNKNDPILFGGENNVSNLLNTLDFNLTHQQYDRLSDDDKNIISFKTNTDAKYLHLNESTINYFVGISIDKLNTCLDNCDIKKIIDFSGHSTKIIFLPQLQHIVKITKLFNNNFDNMYNRLEKKKKIELINKLCEHKKVILLQNQFLNNMINVVYQKYKNVDKFIIKITQNNKIIFFINCNVSVSELDDNICFILELLIILVKNINEEDHDLKKIILKLSNILLCSDLVPLISNFSVKFNSPDVLINYLIDNDIFIVLPFSDYAFFNMSKYYSISKNIKKIILKSVSCSEKEKIKIAKYIYCSKYIKPIIIGGAPDTVIIKYKNLLENAIYANMALFILSKIRKIYSQYLEELSYKTTYVDKHKKNNIMKVFYNYVNDKYKKISEYDANMIEYCVNIGFSDDIILMLYFASSKNEILQILKIAKNTTQKVILHILKFKKLSAFSKFKTNYEINSDKDIEILIEKKRIFADGTQNFI